MRVRGNESEYLNLNTGLKLIPREHVREEEQIILTRFWTDFNTSVLSVNACAIGD